LAVYRYAHSAAEGQVHTTTTKSTALSELAVYVQVVSALSVFFILVSITIFCLKTHPNLRVPDIVNVSTPAGAPNSSDSAAAWLLQQRTTDQYLPFFYIDCRTVGSCTSRPT